MHPRDYFCEVVKPNIGRFEKEPTSIALAYAACVFTYHFADALAAHAKSKNKHERDRETKAARQELAKRAPAFWVVEGAASATSRPLRRRPNPFMAN